MKTCFTFFALFISCLLINYSSAYTQQIIFNRVSSPEGSYFGMVNGVTQDLNGYMWFSSFGFGLYRYDGYHVTTFRSNARDSGSLASDDVACILADHNGFIWIGTANSGLDRLDPRTGIFTHFRHKKDELSSLSSNGVITILEDHTGIIWIGTESGLNQLDQNTKTFTRYQQNLTDVTSLSCNRVQVLYEDKQGTLWVGTANTQRFYTFNEQGGLNRLNRKTGKFTRYLHEQKNSHSLLNNRIGAIFEDTRGVFWVSTAGDGLHTMDREKETFERHSYDPVHPEKLSGPPPEKGVNLDLNNFFVTEDGSGAIWIASSKRWITRYDPKTQKASHFDSFNGDAQAVQSVTEIFSSRDGILWLTTWAGSIFRIDPFEITIPHVFTGSIVHAIHTDNPGTTWLGTYGEGLIQTDRSLGTKKQFFTTSNHNGLSDSWVSAIYESDDNTLWIGSLNGLSRYNKKTKTFIRYLNDPREKTSITKGYVDAIIKDKAGSLWVATQGGLDHFDITSNRFIHYRNDPNNGTSLSDNDVTALLKDHLGNLWVGTADGTLNLLDAQTKKFKRFHCSRDIGTILEDAENVVWVGTANGLYRRNPGVDTFLNLSIANIGLTSATVIAGILEDDQKNLWVASSAGILRFSPTRKEIGVYGKNQNVDPSALTQTRMHGAKGRKGELFFADRTGYYAFFPDQIKKNTIAPQIVINGFRLANKNVTPAKDGHLTLPLNQTREIRLNYNQNVFSFDFAGIHYRSCEDNQHFFMLENLDNKWRKAGIEKTAYYYNVPPGKYIFRVKAANSDGVWAEKAISVIINPPWYSTWWAYTLFSAVFLIVLWSFIKWRESVLKKEKTLLEEKVIMRTHELQSEKEKVESTLSELKTTQKHLIESEKTAAVSKLQQAMLNERLRISRELHDDIGSTLSGIVLYSHLAENQIQSEQINEAEKSLDTIQQSANDMVNRLNDIVWAVNPEHNSLKSLMQKLEEYAMEIAIVKNMKVQMKTSVSLAEIQLPVESCHNIYLLAKEAINNAIKYSNASLLELSVHHSDHSIEFTIKDNGKGFDMSSVKKGNGLINMQKRADEAAATFSVQSAPQEGTLILLRCKIT